MKWWGNTGRIGQGFFQSSADNQLQAAIAAGKGYLYLAAPGMKIFDGHNAARRLKEEVKSYDWR
ncbi:MAG: hypothetical protein H6581_24070 [Bacteroidia bacterium]|nr:hypothetical protein [Bacteroidia bacterium]